MILFSAEAILASNTSKFGIEIPRVDDEDLNSSTESTNSTSLIHCIASVSNCEQERTSVLNLIFQQGREFVKMKIRNLQSLLVYLHNSLKSLLHWRWLNLWLTVQTGISDLELVFVSILSFTLFHRGWVKRLLDRWTPLIQFLWIRYWWWRIWIIKTFPDIPCVSQLLGGPSLRLGPQKERLSIPSGVGWGVMTLIDWSRGNFHCELVQHPGNPLESFIQFTSFCNSCTLPESSKSVLTLDEFSYRYRVESRTLELPWSFHFCKTSLMSFTIFQFLLPQLSL